MKFKPFDDRMVVELLEQETKLASGIVLPADSLSRQPRRAKVLAIGPQVGTRFSGLRSAVEAAAFDRQREMQNPITVGCEVLCHPYDASEIEVEGRKLHIIKERDVLGVFE